MQQTAMEQQATAIRSLLQKATAQLQSQQTAALTVEKGCAPAQLLGTKVAATKTAPEQSSQRAVSPCAPAQLSNLQGISRTQLRIYKPNKRISY